MINEMKLEEIFVVFGGDCKYALKYNNKQEYNVKSSAQTIRNQYGEVRVFSCCGSQKVLYEGQSVTCCKLDAITIDCIGLGHSPTSDDCIGVLTPC